MDTKYEVIITNKAKRDLKEIYNYISKSLMAKQAADNLMNEFEKYFNVRRYARIL